MKKYFNTTGFCNPQWHYTINPLRGLEKQIYDLIDNNQYFLIHASRQTGKTTLLHHLANQLNNEGKYIGLVFSVESAGYKSISVEDANQVFINSLYKSAESNLVKEYRPPSKEKYSTSMDTLYSYLSDWSSSVNKQIVLLIDEIDSLHDDVLISVLRQLRNGFQLRPNNFPSSIALIGLRDIREYREKARGEDGSLGSGSPFNIKAESFKLENFNKKEVFGLLQQHTDETNQIFTDEVKEKIYDYTSGQPWLVNALARDIVYRIYENDFSKEITLKNVEQAKENLIKRRDTHLDSLLDKLKNPRIKPIVEAIVSGENLIYDNFDNDFLYARDLGIINRINGEIKFSNKIYAEIIPRVLNRNLQLNFTKDFGDTIWYLDADGKLNMDSLLQAFQKFYRRNSESWLGRFGYKEAGQQLLLMAFLQRVINSGGRIEREMAMGNGRTDLEIYFNNQVFVLELKINWHSYTKEDGLEQLSRYLDTVGQQSGYLILFEPRETTQKTWEERIKWNEIKYQYKNTEKNITLVEM